MTPLSPIDSPIDTAMIFAAGRGARMRPLSDRCPKPLLKVGGKSLITWQIEALARAGFKRIVINHAWLGAQIENALGNGEAFNVKLLYSPEPINEGLETAGGIAWAKELIAPKGENIFIAVGGDIFCDYPYQQLISRAKKMANSTIPLMHLVMVKNPFYHLKGDFGLDGEKLLLNTKNTFTFGSVAIYDTRMFADITPGTRIALTPYFHKAINANCATGEIYNGILENIGTPEQLKSFNKRLSES